TEQAADMALKKVFRRFTAPIDELDDERLRTFCSAIPDVTPMGALEPRVESKSVGQIVSLRIVPRAGSPSLEATISDGTGSVVAPWTGRRRIAGVAPGKRIIVVGRGAPTGPMGRLMLFNPRYELLPS